MAKINQRYSDLARRGRVEVTNSGTANVLIIKRLDGRLDEAGQVERMLEMKNDLFGENVYFEFYDRETGLRLDGLSVQPGEIPKDVRRVQVGEAVGEEIDSIVELGDRGFVPIEPTDPQDGKAGYSPLAVALQAAIIVARRNSIAGDDSTARFFRHVTGRAFGPKEYQLLVRPVKGQESLYQAIAIKSLARIPIEYIMKGACLALQALGQSA